MKLREIPSDVGGATSAAVSEQWKLTDRARALRCGREAQALREKAEQWLLSSPEFVAADGRPCPFAIEATLALRAKYGKRVNKAMVLGAWMRYIAGMRDADEYVAEFLPHLKTREVKA